MEMPLDAMDEAPDDVLLARFAQGDAGAARVLTLRMTPRVFAHAVRMLGNRAEAEDVAQEAMLRLWRVASDWRAGEAKVTTWLYRVTANLCLDRLRRGDGIAQEMTEEPVDPAPGPGAAMQEQSRTDALQAALARLPERQRQAVVLRHLDGLGNIQIAEIMGISAEAVESLTARGKRALSADLAGRQAELGYRDE
ncbi:RNA polymerase sigma factor [Roseovarius pelagicus]|uniref:RNA polymerase sigma factor n=1 Tax=Roseovarius pelagicus TaxID=2980108 RepID=A0ABY6DGB2_9RHOB|nr:RNA polymerase sigma factor [Roseovarius pelagicus]UXX85199.1 RNA polymerase sigma factor [Roseovarius pelagicus]